ncbi:class B sortase [Oscillibacter sp.]|uniref:class B sortase n=1 Tax=Oscillibacter sp. TaxID=1945593 RepID=UPI002607A9B3|nr:class B sortase [Oscillibacter sp.]MDD3346346.1 class B sortase [Oscillibacter sp.]
MTVNRKLRIILIVILAAVFVGSAAMLLCRELDYQKGEETYAEAQSLVELPDFTALETPAVESAPAEEGAAGEPYVDPYADALRSMDFTALREVNGDVLGWILIPGTPISYPLVQGTDNFYYLKHTWKKQSSAVGAIFLESRSSGDLSDFNTVVYGHRMNNGSMFASLKNYKKQSYWASHPCVYLTDDTGSHKYDIFAAYEVSTSGETYQIGFSGQESKQAFLDYCVAQSVIQTGITPTVNDRVVTLSTCTGNGHATRWVVQAVLRGVAVAESPEEAPAQTPEEAPAQTTEEAPTQMPEETPDQTMADTAADGEEGEPSTESTAEP